jgi:hypothetical protein
MNTSIKFATVTLLAALPALAQIGGDAKGIYLDQSDDRKPAMKFSVLLNRDGEQKTVPSTFTFQDGDQMKFRFELNKDSYIYVLHRSVEGANSDKYAGERGIEVIRDDDRKNKNKESYQLLFPNDASGQTNLVRAHSLKSIPTTDGSFFRMDKNPGMEKLLVVVSAKPIDITKYFDIKTGKMRDDNPPAAGGGNNRKPKNDTDDDVLGQLTRALLDYSGNSTVQSAKGIDVVDGYASANSGTKPMLVTVDLKHQPAR